MKRFRYRDSDSGQFISENEAKRLPPETWEREQVKPPQNEKKPKNK